MDTYAEENLSDEPYEREQVQDFALVIVLLGSQLRKAFLKGWKQSSSEPPRLRKRNRDLKEGDGNKQGKWQC